MKTIFRLFVCTLLLYSLPVFATRYHVSVSSGNDANDGLKWSTAFKNLQAALDLIDDGDEIWIAAGTYYPTRKIADVSGSRGQETKPTNDRHRSFLIRKNVTVYGGFPKNPSDAISTNSRNWQVNQTVLSGDFDDNDGDNFENMGENAFHVVVLFNAKPSLVLDGLYITGGCANDEMTTYVDEEGSYYVTGRDGGGIYAYAPVAVSSPTIRNVSFYGNYAQAAGGGMFNYAFDNFASPNMTNVSIVHNKAANRHGGGLYNNGGGSVYAKLVNLNVVGNESTMSGGGLYFFSIEECSPTITNTVVSGNHTSNGNGGGIYISTFSGDTEPVFANTTVCGNKAAKAGGGLVVYSEGECHTSILNTVIWGNRGTDFDNFYADGEWGAANIFSGSFIEGIDGLGATNLPGNTDPKFLAPVSANLAPTLDGDYQLTLASPLINKGINASITASNDLLGNARIYGGTVDIGAYESQGKEPSTNETVAGERTVWSYNGTLYVKINQTTTLHVYGIDGTLVKHVNNMGEGTYEFALPRGFYVVTLSNGVVEKIIIR